ncbi:hypothetical protein EV702DRAFT_1197368 [Suillus placidus]|uniref:Uncharacterized protein n=1 Tax=Suillus placidus TaxID=48579 RepID=A0A9P7D3R9_9AGAM|nr:hypothetical protein EV702DRAFT_1197368 [Suillus placidus]
MLGGRRQLQTPSEHRHRYPDRRPEVYADLYPDRPFQRRPPKSRASLCITQTVSLDQLNKPLPADLLHEVRRFDAIEVNTYVRRGLRDGELVPVPDAESDMAIAPVSYMANFLQDPPESAKRQRDDERSSSVISVERTV